MSFPTRRSVGVLALAALAACANPQRSTQVALRPEPGSTLTGTVSFTEHHRAATADVVLRGLAPGQAVTVTFHSGSCAQPSASSAVLAIVTADRRGHGHATGIVTIRGVKPIPFSQVTDGQHIVETASRGAVTACGSIPRHR